MDDDWGYTNFGKPPDTVVLQMSSWIVTNHVPTVRIPMMGSMAVRTKKINNVLTIVHMMLWYDMVWFVMV